MSRLIAAVSLAFVSAASAGSTQDRSAVPMTIPGVIAKGTVIEFVRGGFQRLEGPVRAPDGGIFFSDIYPSLTYRLSADGTIEVWRDGTNGTNGLILLGDGRLLAAERDAFRVAVVTPAKQVTAVATACNGKPLRGPNDLIADRKGGIYFTDPGPRYEANVMPTEKRNVCYVRPDGTVRLIDDQMVYPNGISLSLDERTLYVADSFSEYLFAFDVQADGSVTNKRPFVKLREPEQWPPWGLRGRADGLAIDSSGRLYVGTVSGIQVIEPSGRYLGTIRTPEVPRNLAFAGPDRRTLYITSDSLYRIQMLSQGPRERSK